MCQTGGPRCYTEAKKSADKAEAAFHVASARVDMVHEQVVAPTDFAMRAGNRVRGEARAQLEEAFADLAASKQGAAELQARLWAPDGDMVPRGMQRAHLIMGEGEFRRARGAVARAVRERHHMDDLTGIVGKTGDSRVDALVEQATRNMALAPDEYPGWAHGLAPLNPPNTEDERGGLIHALRTAIYDKSIEVDRRQRWADEAARDVAMTASTVESDPNNHEARARLVDARRRLVEHDRELCLGQADLAMTAVKMAEAERVPLRNGTPATRRAQAVRETLADAEPDNPMVRRLRGIESAMLQGGEEHPGARRMRHTSEAMGSGQ